MPLPKKEPQNKVNRQSRITSFVDCINVQERRVQAKKRGYAKAVRNWLLINHPDDYATMKAQLPVTWVKPKEEDDDDSKTS